MVILLQVLDLLISARAWVLLSKEKTNSARGRAEEVLSLPEVLSSQLA